MLPFFVAAIGLSAPSPEPVFVVANDGPMFVGAVSVCRCDSCPRGGCESCQCDPWAGYRAALVAVRSGKRVVLHVGVKGNGFACPAFPGKPTGVYDCWIEDGEPVFRRRVEVPVSGPFSTPTTPATAAGVTSTSSAVGVQMGRTFIGAGRVVTSGFTDPNCVGPT